MFYSLKQPRWLSVRHATRYPHPSELPTNHLLWYAERARARGRERERDIYMIFVRNIFLDNGGPENSGKHSHGDIDDICKINLTPFFFCCCQDNTIGRNVRTLIGSDSADWMHVNGMMQTC